MSISASLLPEFDQEMASTRRVLERIPDDKFDWKLHEKSWAMGGLATHLANLPTWTGFTINQDSLDLAPPEGGSFVVEPKGSRQELLDYLRLNDIPAPSIYGPSADEGVF